MQINEPFYLYTLKESLSSRQRKNPAYSLRAFAKELEIDSSNLSAILQDKRSLPQKRAGFIARKLRLSPKESALFVASSLKKQMAIDAIQVVQDAKNYLLDEKYYKIISEWEYYAFLQLLNVKGFTSDFPWITARLNISDSRARLVVRDLLDLGFIKNDPKKGYIRATPSLETSENVESQALQEAHKDSLDIAKAKLDSIPVELRDFSSITMAINTQMLPEARAIIREFQEKMHALLTKDSQDEVYQFSCQLFPLTTGGGL